MNSKHLLTCAEFEALVPDLLEDALSPRDRERMDAHRLDCNECDALAADLLDIRRQAANLPTLSPSHDLWSGIASRIEAEVVQLPVTPIPGEVPAIRPMSAVAVTSQPAPLASRPTSRRSALGSRLQFFAAASVLVVATAAITWSVASRGLSTVDHQLSTVADTGLAALEGTVGARAVSRPSMVETYDREIAKLREIVELNRADLDTATLAVLEKNMKLIDQAIAESRAALEASPGSAFLVDRLSEAYASKLRTLRAVAASPNGG